MGRDDAGSRAEPARAHRGRDAARRLASRSPTRPDTPRTTSPTCTTGPRSSATSAACGSRPPRWRSRRRRRRTSTSRRGTSRSTGSRAWRPRATGDDALRRQRGRRRPARRRSARRLDALGASSRGRRDAGGVHRRRSGRDRGRHASPSATRAFRQAAPPDQLYAGSRATGQTRAEPPCPPAAQSAGILAAMSQTVELPRVGGPGSGLGGLWRVVVLNDDHNTFDHVAETLASVIPGCHPRRRLPDRRPDPQHGLRDRLERPARGRRGLLGAASTTPA